MCLTFHIRALDFFLCYKRKIFTQKIYVYIHKKSFFPGLPNLEAQIRCAQNWYTAVQMDLK